MKSSAFELANWPDFGYVDTKKLDREPRDKSPKGPIIYYEYAKRTKILVTVIDGSTRRH